MRNDVAAIWQREGLSHTTYKLLLRSLGSDAAIMAGIRDAETVHALIKNIGLAPKRKPRGHIC